MITCSSIACDGCIFSDGRRGEWGIIGRGGGIGRRLGFLGDGSRGYRWTRCRFWMFIGRDLVGLLG